MTDSGDRGHPIAKRSERVIRSQGAVESSARLMDSAQIEPCKREGAVGAKRDAELAFRIVVPPGVVEHPGGGAGHRGGERVKHLCAMLVLTRLVEPPHRGEKQSIPLVRRRVAGV